MGIAPEATVEGAELLVNHRVVRDVLDELFLLRLVRQFALHEEIAGLHEIALLGEFGDVVAAIEQHAFVAVDVGDFGAARAGRGEARIVGENAGVAVELADIDQTRSDGSVDDRHFVGFAGFVVGQRGGRLGHWTTLSARFAGFAAP
jgi:hypothetical protein